MGFLCILWLCMNAIRTCMQCPVTGIVIGMVEYIQGALLPRDQGSQDRFSVHVNPDLYKAGTDNE